MPLPFLAVAIPVIHSSGAWIASTAASGYIAGSLSTTWIGAFVLGNSSLLSSLGLVSAAGVFGATGGIATLSSGAAFGLGSSLTSVGLGGVASAVGVAPVATFLGLTPIGWALAGTTAAALVTFGYYFTTRTMSRINVEREKGGLPPIKLTEIVKEVRLLEASSLETILAKICGELSNVHLSLDRKEVRIDGQLFSVNRLKYVVNSDGSEEIVFITRTGRKKRVLLVKQAGEIDGLSKA
jgi:hypothetical protein